ncbi:SPAG8 protein, partial [Dromas ardeola]|nr:SPAG8 protein [Dromas ardeola]
PAEQPRLSMPWGTCLIHNWQEERAANHLGAMPGQQLGSEGFTHRHGHHGLLVNQLLSCPTNSTTTKDTYRPPHRGTLLRVPARGGGDPRAERCGFCSAGREEMLEKICPPRKPMESVSTTHRDYCGGGSTLMEPTRLLCPPQTCRPPCSLSRCFHLQPHNYCTEQPCSFWLEQAHRLPGVTSIRSRDSPFRRNAAFSTPITESLEQPLPCTPPSRQLQPHKQ